MGGLGCCYPPTGRGHQPSHITQGSAEPWEGAGVLLPCIWWGPWAQFPSQSVPSTQVWGAGHCAATRSLAGAMGSAT